MSITQVREPYMAQVYDLLIELLGHLGSWPFAMRLPDGTVIPPSSGEAPPFTLVLNRPGALRRMFLPPSELAMGESYIFGDYDIEGDIIAAFEFIDELKWPRLSPGTLLRLGWKLLKLKRAGGLNDLGGTAVDDQFTAFHSQGKRYSKKHDQESIQFHYDVSNSYYKLWLDERLTYTSAYFEHPDDDLDKAQRTKLDKICRRLDLKPGDRLLDIGCGWGGLCLHAATHYAATAVGIGLGEAQTEEAISRAQTAKLSDRCHFFVNHYEEFESETPFDKLVSVGMAEHVGPDRLAGYFTKAYQLLKPGGHFLLQMGVGRTGRRHAGRRWMDRLGMGRLAFTQKYGFPNGELADLAFVLGVAERTGFEVRHLEGWREHYALTAQHWVQRLQRCREAATAIVGEAAFRAWVLQFAAFVHLLRKGYLAHYHMLLAKPPVSFYI